MNKKQQTIDTYNTNASRMADKFNKIGVRLDDIKEVFNFVKKENPFVLEIGCGNGRDAEEIIKRTNNYLGIDIAEKFIEIASKQVPQARFEVADVESYKFPQGIDVVIAFASLIHVPKDSLMNIMEKIFNSLNSGGIVRLSMKHANKYSEVVKDDEFGTRTYYFYSQNDIKELVKGFTIIRNDFNPLRDQDWVETILLKN